MSRSIARTLLKSLAWLLLIGFAAAGFVVYAQKLQLLTVQTGSMRPSIDPGDVVAVKNVPHVDLVVGDVITFMPDGKNYSVTHRLRAIDRKNSRFITQGDANTGVDESIRFDQVIGRVHYVVPFGGYIVGFVTKPLGLVAAIYLPALFILVTEVRRLTAHYKKLQPYILPSYEPRHVPRPLNKRSLIFAKFSVGLLILGLGVSVPAWAVLRDSVTLAGNTISTVGTEESCHNNNNNNVAVNVNTNQTAQTGDANNSNNTNGGSATSGNASNSNSTNINVNINNC